jgi:hypothetical protein
MELHCLPDVRIQETVAQTGMQAEPFTSGRTKPELAGYWEWWHKALFTGLRGLLTALGIRLSWGQAGVGLFHLVIALAKGGCFCLTMLARLYLVLLEAQFPR